jgi:hypothetical protein
MKIPIALETVGRFRRYCLWHTCGDVHVWAQNADYMEHGHTNIARLAINFIKVVSHSHFHGAFHTFRTLCVSFIEQKMK